METSFIDLSEKWLLYVRYNIAATTLDGYHRSIKRLLPVLPHHSLTGWCSDDLQTALYLMADMGYSKSTIRSARVVLSEIWQYAHRHLHLSLCPLGDLKIPKAAPEKTIEALTAFEEQKIRAACYDDIHGDVFLFLLETGLRRAELCNLLWSDFDKRNKCIYIRKSKTDNGIRCVPLTKLAYTIVIMQDKRYEFIFTLASGAPMSSSSMSRTYRRLRKVTGINKLTNHVCRHTYATRLVESGANAGDVAALLGHAKIAFTLQRYFSPQLDHLTDTVAHFQEYHQNKFQPTDCLSV